MTPPSPLNRVLSQRRVRLACHSLRVGVRGSVNEFLRNILAPSCDTLASYAIRRIEPAGDLMRVWLQSETDPLYYPIGMDARLLHMVICEQCFTWNWHYYRAPETTVSKDDVVFDCGSAEGLFAFLVRRQARRIHCFEPLAAFHKAFSATFANYANITLSPVALSRAPGAAVLSGGGLTACLDGGYEDVEAAAVQVESIDSFCASHRIEPTYIKADLEGHEYEFLEGAAETLSRRPRLAITTYHRKGDAERLSGLIRRICPAYSFRFRGLEATWGDPVLMHAW